MGLERTKFLRYTIILAFILLVTTACTQNKSDGVFYLKNGETYLYENNKSYNLGVLAENAAKCGKYTCCIAENGEFCTFKNGKKYFSGNKTEQFKTSGKYAYYTANGKLYRSHGTRRTVISDNADNFDVVNGLCIYKYDGEWYFENNVIADVKPLFVTEKYAYYLKDDALYYKKYNTSSALVAENVYETAVSGNRVYFFTENYTEKEFNEVFDCDCLEKDTAGKYDEHINHKDIVNYFILHKIPFRLYTLYEAELDTKKKIDDDVCDISSFYNIGAGCMLYKKFGEKKLKLSSLKNITDVYFAVDEKYTAADVYVLKNGEISLEIKNCSADYFEMGDDIYYIVSDRLYAGDKKIADNAKNFKTTTDGTIFTDDDNAYFCLNGKISKIGREAEKIVCSNGEIYFIDNKNLKNTSGTLYKNVDDYKVCGKNIFYISGNSLYNNGIKIDTDVSEIY